MICNLGYGHTSKVYLARSIKEPTDLFALKLLKSEYLDKGGKETLKSVEREISIMMAFDHPGIVKVKGYGSAGTIKKPSGSEFSGMVYILLEYVSGGLLFNLC